MSPPMSPPPKVKPASITGDERRSQWPDALFPPTTLADKAWSATLWLTGLAGHIVGTSVCRLGYRLRPAWEIDGLTRWATRLQSASVFARVRFEISPAIDMGAPAMFVQNHVNALDWATMYPGTPHFKQGIELLSHFKVPFYGPFMEARGTIPVIPGDPQGREHLLARCRAEVEAGRSLLAFPEGTRTRTGRVGPFKTGLLHVARELALPVVPVALTGMFEVMPTGSRMLRPFQPVTVHYLDPIPTAGLSADDVPALAATARDRIAEKVDAYYLSRFGRLPEAP